MNMKNSLVKLLKRHGLFLLILIFAAALRFYRLAEMVSFDFDQEYASNFAYSVLREFPIQLIGQGLSVQGLFMGPLYFYYLVPFFAIFNLHPIGGAVGSVLLGLGIIVAYYYYANKLFGKPAGLIGAFLRAVLFCKLQVDWSMTPAFSSELLVLVTWYCFYQYWKGNTRCLPLLGLVFGLYTSFHPILFPFYLVFLVLLLLRRNWPNLKILLLSIGAFVIPIMPLIVFEYFHKFLEVKLLFNLLLSSKTEAATPFIAKFMTYVKTILIGPQHVLGIEIGSPYLLSGIVLVAMVIFIFKKVHIWQDSFHLLALGITLLAFVLYYCFLPVHVPGYYFMVPITLLFFYLLGLLGYLAAKSGIQLIVMVFLVYVALTNIKILDQIKWSNPSLSTLAYKDRIVKEILKRQPPDKDFFISYIKLPGWNFGFKYLFKLYGRVSQNDLVEGSIYTIVTPKNLTPESIDVDSGNVGLILPEWQK